MDERKKYGFPGSLTAFLAASGAVMIFCVLVHLLGNPLKILPESHDIGSVFLWAGLLLTVIAGAGWLLRKKAYFKRNTALSRRLPVLLGVLMLLWNLAAAADILGKDYEENRTYIINREESLYTRKMVLHRAYGQMKLFGCSESFYTQPVEKLEREELWWRETLLWRWQNDAVLPMLSLHYGSWVLVLYWGVLLSWTAALFLGGRRLSGAKRLLYLSCALPLLLVLAGPGLDSLGLLHYITGSPFLLSDGPVHLLPWLLRLGVMGLLLYDNARNPGKQELSFARKLACCERILLEQCPIPFPDGTPW